MAQRRGTRRTRIWHDSTVLTDPERDSRPLRDLRPFLGIEPASPKPARTACVYFIECGEYVKIGTTTVGAQARFAAMQLPPNARLVAVIEGADHNDEARLHRMFHAYRAGGEWFERCPELDGLIRATPSRCSPAAEDR